MPGEASDTEIEALWLAVAGSAARSIAVVAAHAGEGTTSLAEVLAQRAARSGRRALYVDLSGGHAGGAGLGLAEDVILPGAAPGIGVLANPSAASALAWHDPLRLAAQVREWAGAWDIVLFDTAPLLAHETPGVPPLAAAAAAEATILVVLAGRTTAADLREAQHRLERSRARLLGSVLNDRDNPSLVAEMERELGRIGRFAPGLARRAGNALRRSSLLAQRS
jgi:Mrp family chromosome partitioning ATPase